MAYVVYIEEGCGMRCDNQFCIYWDSGLCLLTAISLDAQGACRDCVEITLPECHPESGPFRLQKGGRKGREPVVSGNPHGTGKYGSYMSRGRRRFRRPLFSVVSRIGMLAVFLLKVLQCHSERLDDERRKRAFSAPDRLLHPGDDIVRDPNAFIRGRWNGWDLDFSHHISPVAA